MHEATPPALKRGPCDALFRGHKWPLFHRPSTQPHRSAFGREDRVWGCYQKRGTAVNHFAGPRVAAAEPIPHPRQCVCRNESGREQCMEIALGLDRARDSGRHLEREGVWNERCIWRGPGEIVLEELPDAAFPWDKFSGSPPLCLTSPSARSGSSRFGKWVGSSEI
ncbi:MAG: hypothetical protein JWN92_106 [Candidatus Acidoferrum typicum]|nr:hypothetical protein [Candidatus Acidoferrum typicum]